MKRTRHLAVIGAAAALIGMVVMPADATTATGPSTSTVPYVLPAVAGVDITSILAVNDSGSAGNGYEMVGIPDGLGAMAQNGKITLLMNQELRDAQGITRRHGKTGAFVSRLVVDPSTLAVEQGSDLINPSVAFYDYPTGTYVTSGARFADGTVQDETFGRFCSGTLSDPGQFLSGAKGYAGQVYFANEEDGDSGRSFAVTDDGQATQLPRFGLFSWENTKPAPNLSETTVVMGQEDGPTDGSQLWVYVGRKVKSGAPLDRAGLTNGTDFVFDAANNRVTNDAEWRATYGKGVGAAVKLKEIPWNQTGAASNAQAKAEGLSLNRIEDGHFDPSHPNDFYFFTTEGGQTEGSGLDARDGGGLWRLRFEDIEKPLKGATLTLLLDGSETVGADEPKLNKPDNMAIDTAGNLLIQEDPGNNNHIARIVAYRIADGALGVVARFDPALFGPGATADPARLTTDEESSGIIDASRLLGVGSYLFDAQVHTAKNLPAGTGPGTVQEYVENGQLLVMRVADFAAIYDRA